MISTTSTPTWVLWVISCKWCGREQFTIYGSFAKFTCYHRDCRMEQEQTRPESLTDSVR